ncbi:kallikrein-2-like [Tubulanus polymorphus]|uniref:kallikrein-2-like n=1 Tax=Tubulanus polymorphus TaxID=672921 RepID=UPI003DA6782D
MEIYCYIAFIFLVARPSSITATEGDWRIINGENAKSSVDMPFVVAVLYDGAHVCGGSLIGTDTVLTAAHCFKDDQQTRLYSVLIGQMNLKSIQTSPESMYHVRDIRIHASWSPDEPAIDDIAIMKLSRPIVRSDKQDIVTLPWDALDTPSTGEMCQVAGWGALNNDMVLYPNQLQLAFMYVESDGICKAMYRSDFFVTNKQFCASGGHNSAICAGDSGGPFICLQGKRYVLHGITSYGPEPCLQTRRPAVFTRLSMYTDWIQNNIY